MITYEEWHEFPKWRKDFEQGAHLRDVGFEFVKNNPEFDTKQNCLADNMFLLEQLWAEGEDL